MDPTSWNDLVRRKNYYMYMIYVGSVSKGSIFIYLWYYSCLIWRSLCRPGTRDPRAAQPSLMVTLDLGTVGYYNQLVLFNTLNSALNKGEIAQYSVSPKGFTFRALAGKSHHFHLIYIHNAPCSYHRLIQCHGKLQCCLQWNNVDLAGLPQWLLYKKKCFPIDRWSPTSRLVTLPEVH